MNVVVNFGVFHLNTLIMCVVKT